MEWLHNTVLGRVVLLAVLVLVLQIPIHWIHGLVGEREANRLAAVAEVQASAGGVQMAGGPAKPAKSSPTSSRRRRSETRSRWPTTWRSPEATSFYSRRSIM